MKRPKNINDVVGKFVSFYDNGTIEYGFLTPRLVCGCPVIISVCFLHEADYENLGNSTSAIRFGQDSYGDFVVIGRLDRVMAPWREINQIRLNHKFRKIATQVLCALGVLPMFEYGNRLSVGCKTNFNRLKFLQTLKAIKRRYRIKFDIPKELLD